MADVFISYSHTDRAAAQNIAVALQNGGLTVWWDTSLVAGDVFSETIRAELESARSVLVIWSEASWKSRWVQSEAEYGMQASKLAAVRIDTCEIGPPFNIVHTADLRTLDETTLAEVVRGIRARIEHKAIATPTSASGNGVKSNLVVPVSVAFLLAVTFGAIVVLNLRPQSAAPSEGSIQSSQIEAVPTPPVLTSESVGNAPKQSNVAPSSAEATVLVDYFRPETLGQNLEYIQSKIGPPIFGNDSVWTFLIQGCEVRMFVDGSDKIQSVDAIEMYVSPQCSPNWATIDSQFANLPPVYETTVGQFRTQSGLNQPPRMEGCISNCGNTVGPYMEWLNEGPRVRNLDVSVGAPVFAEVSWDDLQPAINRLKASRLARGVRDTGYVSIYYCDADAPVDLGDALDANRIRSIRIERVRQVAMSDCQ